MRSLFFAFALVLGACAAGRPATTGASDTAASGTAAPGTAAHGADGSALLVRTERAAWDGAGRALRAFDRIFELDPYAGEDLADRLVRVRRRAYEAGRTATQALAAADFAAALRTERGDAVPACADEVALRHHLDRLIAIGDDLVEVDDRLFVGDGGEAFEAPRMDRRMDEELAALRALVEAHASEAEDVCRAAPAPHHEPRHRP
jgi:hypothetical protein